MPNILKKIIACSFLVLVIGSALGIILQREFIIRREEDPDKFHPAMYFDKLFGKMVQCRLCPNQCILSPGQYGLCKARKNIDGKLYSLVYGKIATWHIDPIEKKPFFHVLPGSRAFSFATTGCNIQCLFCQNWEISQVFPFDIPTQSAAPEEAIRQTATSGSRIIAFTYVDPTIFY